MLRTDSLQNNNHTYFDTDESLFTVLGLFCISVYGPITVDYAEILRVTEGLETVDLARIVISRLPRIVVIGRSRIVISGTISV